jgi:DNA (cytosine-5)-methyltransferase 1
VEHENQPGTVLDVILNEFKKSGYTTDYGVLDAVNYGVPLFRERFVLIDSRDHEDIYVPMQSHFQMHQNKNLRWITVYDDIGDLENDYGEYTSFSEERMQYLKVVPQDVTWRNLLEEAIKAPIGGAYESGGGKVRFYRRSD